MKNGITFGGEPTRDQKMAIAEGRKYDSGKPSTGSKPPPKAKIKPVIGKGKVGITITKKY